MVSAPTEVGDCVRLRLSRKPLGAGLRWAMKNAGMAGRKPALRRGADVMKKPYSSKQGQYLAFIFYYSKIHGRAPAELDMQSYFKVTPPSVHQMVLTLAANGFIERVPGEGRSIRLLIPREELPELE